MSRRRDGLPKLLLLAHIADRMRRGLSYQDIAKQLSYSRRHIIRLAALLRSDAQRQ